MGEQKPLHRYSSTKYSGVYAKVPTRQPDRQNYLKKRLLSPVDNKISITPKFKNVHVHFEEKVFVSNQSNVFVVSTALCKTRSLQIVLSTI
jgi:hypothetical protein